MSNTKRTTWMNRTFLTVLGLMTALLAVMEVCFRISSSDGWKFAQALVGASGAASLIIYASEVVVREYVPKRFGDVSRLLCDGCIAVALLMYLNSLDPRWLHTESPWTVFVAVVFLYMMAATVSSFFGILDSVQSKFESKEWKEMKDKLRQ